VITSQNLKKNKGNFIVLYKNEKDRISRIYFRFKIIAKITLFKAKNNITNGKILSRKNYERVVTKFDKIPMNFIDAKSLNGYISRNYIRKGQILTTFLLKKKKLIQKRDSVTAIIRNGGLQLEFIAKALNSGNKNEYIQVINSSGKVFRVKVTGPGTVEVQ
jgi:flagella basal body P-ring formation protein FlgA